MKVIFCKFEMFQNMKTKNAPFQVPVKKEVPWSLSWNADLSADFSVQLSAGDVSAGDSVFSDLVVDSIEEVRRKKVRRGPEHGGTDPGHVSPEKPESTSASIDVKCKMRPPIKPASSFTIFVKQHKTALRKKGSSEDEAMNESVKKWRNLSPAVKNKYQDKYLKMKASYEIKLKGFEDKMKVRKERFEQQKGMS